MKYINNKPAFCIFLFCFIAAALSAGEIKEYKNEAFDFSLSYPADWNLEEIEIGIILSSMPDFFDFKEESAGIALFVSPIDNMSSEQTLQSNEDVWEALKTNTDTIEEKSVKTIEWLGKQWLVAEFYEKTDDCNAVFYFLVEGDLVYLVGCLYHPPEAQDSYTRIIEEIISSLRFHTFEQ